MGSFELPGKGLPRPSLMYTKVNFVQAFHGDSILVEHESQKGNITILIDGGPKKAFTRKSGKQLISGPLKKELDKLIANSKKIDLLILSHVDSDHIGGIIKAFKHPNYLSYLTKKVLFNSPKVISTNAGIPPPPTFLDLEYFGDTRETSYKEGAEFEDILLGLDDIWHRESVIALDKYILNEEMAFHFLSPTQNDLDRMLTGWAEDNKSTDTETSGCKNDYEYSCESLLEADKFVEDPSVTNASSISFILSIGDKNMLFLGDAWPSSIVESLRKLEYTEEKKLKCCLVKISHHGSKGNTNNELLDLLDCDDFVITTDGSAHCLPHKLALARILNHSKSTKIHFNYPELINRIYSPAELEKYDGRVLPLDKDFVFK